MNFKYSIILLFSIALFACTKEEEVENPNRTTVDEYMKAIVDGDSVIADYIVVLQDPVFNGFYPNSEYFQVQRLVENGSAEGFNLIAERINLNTIDYPFTLRYSEHEDSATLLFNYYTPDDTAYAMNIADTTSFTVVLTGYNNEVLTGTFEGELYKENQSSVTIEDGTFQIEMEVY
tara:strand:+ start:531 stop:1058 length:528 start_codon:yes stop_codon:yes gene_type:complete